MSTPQTESPAPAKKTVKAGKAPLSEAAQQNALNNAERAARESLSDAQVSLGRQRRLEKAARKDPAVADVLDQNRALQAVVDQLREELAATKAELATSREQLTSALAPKKD